MNEQLIENFVNFAIDQLESGEFGRGDKMSILEDLRYDFMSNDEFEVAVERIFEVIK